MYVWTKKAETDYRAKHPHRKNERKAGTEALWENKPLDRTIRAADADMVKDNGGESVSEYYYRNWRIKEND